MKKALVLFVLISVGMSIVGCKKYDNGGLRGKADKRITNKWKLESYYRNGNDETSALLISNLVEEFQEGGVLVRTYIDENNDQYSETGTWELVDDNESIKVTGIGSVQLTNETSTVTTSDYTIIRLKKDEMWYMFNNGGDDHEFHFVLQ